MKKLILGIAIGLSVSAAWAEYVPLKISGDKAMELHVISAAEAPRRIVYSLKDGAMIELDPQTMSGLTGEVVNFRYIPKGCVDEYCNRGYTLENQ